MLIFIFKLIYIIIINQKDFFHSYFIITISLAYTINSSNDSKKIKIMKNQNYYAILEENYF